MSDDQTSLVHCIIPDPKRQRLLLIDVEGRADLPTLERDRLGWFAMDVEAIGPRLKDAVGLDVTVLRDLGSKGHLHWCEVEVHGGSPSHGQWVPIERLPALPQVHETVVNTWLKELAGAHVPPMRPPWERPGWYGQAVSWIHDQMEDLKLERSGPVQQFKGAWSWSCILVVPTSAGKLFFKACYDKPPGEVALILALQPRWAQCLPRLLAADERGWMLMENFEGELIEEMSPERWGAAAGRFAQLQIDCAGDAADWLAMGCPDRRPERLPSLLDKVLDDEELLLSEPNPLTTTNLKRLRDLQPLLQQLCEHLAVSPVPSTLHNQDFRSGNLVAIGRDFLFYDWGDTVLSHPFFSVQRMLDYVSGQEGVPRWHWQMRHRADRLRRTIRDSYLSQWESLASRRQLREDFVLSRQLNPLYQAVRWYHEIQYVEVESPWGRLMRHQPGSPCVISSRSARLCSGPPPRCRASPPGHTPQQIHNLPTSACPPRSLTRNGSRRPPPAWRTQPTT